MLHAPHAKHRVPGLRPAFLALRVASLGRRTRTRRPGAAKGALLAAGVGGDGLLSFSWQMALLVPRLQGTVA